MTRIYISSTFTDLERYRAAVISALRRIQKDVVAMEDAVARNARPMDQCRADVASCDVYVGIFAHRYGYMPPHDNPEGKSITELEYRHAVGLGKPCLVFLLKDEASWPLPLADAFNGEGERGERIKALRQELGREQWAKFFSRPDELAELVNSSVTVWEQEQNQSTPVNPGPESVARLPQPREIEKDVLLAYYGVDDAVARHIADQLLPRNRSFLLSPRALFAESAEDFRDLEKAARRCHTAAVVLSDAGLDQLEENRERTGRVLDLLKARTGSVAGLCLGPGPLARVGAWPFSHVLDLTFWPRDGSAPPVDLLVALDRWIVDRNPVPGTRPVGLPFVVVAMNEKEARDLDERPERVQEELGRPAYEQFLKVKAALEAAHALPFAPRYNAEREEWKPFLGSPAPVRALIEEVVRQINSSQQARLRGRSIKVQRYPFDDLVSGSGPLRALHGEIAQSGCVMVLDELSLFHPSVRGALLGSPQLASDHVSLITLSPLDVWSQPPYDVFAAELKQRLAAAFDRFDLHDPQCELGVGDERRLRRWLHSRLPEALQMLREPRPNPRALDLFAEELGVEDDLRIAGRLYDGGVL
jgi:transcriptional regulator with XRE-family HTH domain